MWQGSYGKEPFNMRLTILRMISKLPLILGITLVGTIVLGGIYYAKNVLLRSEHIYAATSTYHVDYAVTEEKDVGTVHINQYSWNTYLQTELILNAVQAQLTEAANTKNLDNAGAFQLTNQELGSMLTATVPSDLRVVSTTVSCHNPDVALMVAAAVEAAITEEFVTEIREIVAINVIDSPEAAEEVIPDVRVGRALILSGVLTCFFAVVVLLLKETGEDGIWLPNTIWKRYGIRVVGYLCAENTEVCNTENCENLVYFCQGKSKVAICPVTPHVNPGEVLKQLRECCPQIVGDEWFVLPTPRICPEVCETLRTAEGILLAVPAGAHSGRMVEWTLEYLQQQDCDVTAAILVDADDTLIRNYYRFE